MLTDPVPVAEAPTPPTLQPQAPLPILIGPYSLNVDNCSVAVDGRAPVILTRFEMTLLLHLVRQAGSFVSKGELVRLMYNGQRLPESNGLEVFVGRIRRKIDPGKILRPIETVRYSGYRFRNDWLKGAAQ